ncbi:hypothetical protein [Comamonas avium]|uniref:Uncharacterized protein n=1 Tax=Comamonas avium TaxID=2762231 RepID=A0ABR8S785_9BURK|nr:hypothetical protein [Comamonas avium]MBD7959337.1 hypothetical protein [Comamonas avium]
MRNAIYHKMDFGQLALQKLGQTDPNFRLYLAGIKPEPPKEWTHMEVVGAVSWLHTEPVRMLDHKSMSPSKQEARQRKRWSKRPWRFKLNHRMNVLAAWVQGWISTKSLASGLRYPHAIVALPVVGESGMLLVCPDAIEVMFGGD